VKFLLRLFPALHLVVSLLFVCCALALIGLAVAQLWTGIQPFEPRPTVQRLNAVLEGLALLTVAVAALELGQTILEEEVQRAEHMSAPTRVRRFLSRFLVVLVVAMSIESLVIAFRTSHESPKDLVYAAAVGLTAAALLAAWGLFIWLNTSAEELEPEAMERAKREDAKVDPERRK
jgi:hypothetical protein